jgi:hypothetical protein
MFCYNHVTPSGLKTKNMTLLQSCHPFGVHLQSFDCYNNFTPSGFFCNYLIAKIMLYFRS